MLSVVVYDANVLFPAGLRDMLLELSALGGLRAHFSTAILGEVTRNLARHYPDVEGAVWDQLAVRMANAARGICVEFDETTVSEHPLPDSDDQHVLGLAIQVGAQVIVTDNLSDFPVQALRPLGLRAVTADQFLTEIALEEKPLLIEAVDNVVARRSNPPVSRKHLLARAGLATTLEALANDLPE